MNGHGVASTVRSVHESIRLLEELSIQLDSRSW
jgi:hypothetical protein